MLSTEVRCWFSRVAVWFVLQIDRFCRALGIRLYPINVGVILKGLPQEVALGVHDPDLAEPFSLMIEDME